MAESGFLLRIPAGPLGETLHSRASLILDEWRTNSPAGQPAPLRANLVFLCFWFPVYRGFWAVLLLLGVVAALTASFLIICAAPFASHFLYKAGGGSYIAAGRCSTQSLSSSHVPCIPTVSYRHRSRVQTFMNGNTVMFRYHNSSLCVSHFLQPSHFHELAAFACWIPGRQM